MEISPVSPSGGPLDPGIEPQDLEIVDTIPIASPELETAPRFTPGTAKSFDFSPPLTGKKRPSQEQLSGQTSRIRPNSLTFQEAINSARSLLIKAADLAPTHSDQTKVLDFIGLFREFLETGNTKTVGSILSRSAQDIERVVKTLGNKANSLNKQTPPTRIEPPHHAPPQNLKIHNNSKKVATTKPTTTPSWASVAQSGNQEKSPEFTVVTRKSKNIQTGRYNIAPGVGPSDQEMLAPKKSTKSPDRRLVLVLHTTTQGLPTPREIRDKFNKEFAAKGYTKPVISLVTESRTKKSIILTTTDQFDADFLLANKAIWEALLPIQRAAKDESWYKVVIHGLPIKDFNTEEGLLLIHDEIKTFNGLTTVGTPFWLTHESKRNSQLFGSIVVSFSNEADYKKALTKRMNIAGLGLRTEKLILTPKTYRCENCQQFGHLENRCKRPTICRVCADSHATPQHSCGTSGCLKGQACKHMEPKCANCGENHQASFKRCPKFMAIKNSTL